MWNVFSLSAYANKRLYIVVPRRNVLVADRPIHSVSVFYICFEVQVAPTVSLSGPKQRTAADNVRTNPIKSFYFCVRIFKVVDVEVFVVFLKGIVSWLNMTLCFVLFGKSAAMREVPRIKRRSGVIRMIHRFTTLQQQNLQAFFAQLFGCPAPTYSGTDDDGVVTIIFRLLDQIHALS